MNKTDLIIKFRISSQTYINDNKIVAKIIEKTNWPFMNEKTNLYVNNNLDILNEIDSTQYRDKNWIY